MNGGSGWTRTTDLTLISRQFILIKPFKYGFIPYTVYITVYI